MTKEKGKKKESKAMKEAKKLQEQGRCFICKSRSETRMGACWHCIEAETIVLDGEDMNDNTPSRKVIGSLSLKKVAFLLEKGWKHPGMQAAEKGTK